MRKLVGEIHGIKLYSDDDPFFDDKVILDAGSMQPVVQYITDEGVHTVFELHPERLVVVNLATPEAETVTVFGRPLVPAQRPLEEVERTKPQFVVDHKRWKAGPGEVFLRVTSSTGEWSANGKSFSQRRSGSQSCFGRNVYRVS